jgi:hypothetical protein
VAQASPTAKKRKTIIDDIDITTDTLTGRGGELRAVGVVFIDQSRIGFVLVSTNMQWSIAILSRIETQHIGVLTLRLIYLDEIR